MHTNYYSTNTIRLPKIAKIFTYNNKSEYDFF